MQFFLHHQANSLQLRLDYGLSWSQVVQSSSPEFDYIFQVDWINLFVFLFLGPYFFPPSSMRIRLFSRDEKALQLLKIQVYLLLSQFVGVPGVSIVVQNLSTMLLLIFFICTPDHTRTDAFCCSAGIARKRKWLHKLSSCSHSLGPRSNTRAVILQHTLREKSLEQVTHWGLTGDKGGQTTWRLGRGHHGL